ncbi:MAG: hypothetical protein ACR2PX_19060 [Endozoicomonas sp.]
MTAPVGLIPNTRAVSLAPEPFITLLMEVERLADIGVRKLEGERKRAG